MKKLICLLLAACGGSSDAPPGSHGGIDAGRADAAVIDAAVIDAAVIDAAVIDAAAPVDAPPGLGLRASYFRKYAGKALERIDATVDFMWPDAPAAEVGADHFSVRWSGTLAVPAAGRYTFVTSGDDGARLWIGDQLIIDDWTFHAAQRHEGSLELPAGPVAIRLEYFDRDYAAEARLFWRSDAIAEAIIPAEQLRPAAADDAGAPLPPYENPVNGFDCPDPGVLADGGNYYMVCTGGGFTIRRSDDLVLWEDSGAKVFPAGKPAWALNGFRNWAPELHRVGNHYIAYYTSVDSADRLAIGAAWASAPEGPYTDAGAPLVQDNLGAIDASYFKDDDGRHYLTYKIDGNSAGQPTPILARELAADGLSFAPGSTAKELLRNSGATWEGGVVEGQWHVKRDGRYYLFYSGNVYDHRYRTGVARADSFLGPYVKKGDPILANNSRWVGPGHGSVIAVGGADYFVYHAWPANPGGTHDGAQGRHGLLDEIVWQDGWPTISDGTPSRGLQAWPAE